MRIALSLRFSIVTRIGVTTPSISTGPGQPAASAVTMTPADAAFAAVPFNWTVSAPGAGSSCGVRAHAPRISAAPTTTSWESCISSVRHLTALLASACFPAVRRRQLLEQGVAEGIQVVGFAAGDETVVRHEFLVHPAATGIADVGLQAGPGRQLAPVYDRRLHQHPRPVADGRDGLAEAEELTGELHGVLVQAQRIGVGDTAGQHQRVIDLRAGLADLPVHVESVPLVEVTEALNPAVLRGDRSAACAGFLPFGQGPCQLTCSTPSVARKAIFLPASD